MAVRFLQFSTLIPYATDAQRLWLVDQFQSINESEDGPICLVKDKPTDRALWVYADIYGDPERIADIVAAFQIRFHIQDPWIINWSDTIDRPNLERFSVGTIAVYRGSIRSFDPTKLITAWVTRAQRRIATTSRTPRRSSSTRTR
jgi:hypothetical protein